MSDSSPDAPDVSVLGKRGRNETGNDPQASDIINPTVEDDSDDDDVGPMPMPAQAPAAKKKRRGIANVNFEDQNSLINPLQVLPHERLYLQHLPSTDQYYKSFMHRDTINFSVVTK
jgi:peptidylprolyl isomerase domain and WD repeat-containing protein 1